MIKNYFKIAFRGFWRHKLFTLINIIGLSIGISAALVIYLIVHFDFNFDKFHKDGERIYRVVSNFSFQGNRGYNGGVCGPLAGAVKSQVPGVEVAAPTFSLSPSNEFIPQAGLRGAAKGSAPVKFKNKYTVLLAGDEYFKIFEYKWLAGSPKNALAAPNQVVLTSEQANKYFPSTPYSQMIGRMEKVPAMATSLA